MLAEKYKNKEELQAYAEAQYKTIIKLTKQIARLQEDNEILKQKLNAMPSTVNIENPKGITDEEAICVMEIHKLRAKSLNDELTMEECRKLETYVKTLATVRNQPKKSEISTQNISTDDLLKHFDLMMEDTIDEQKVN